ncbi:MAG TPA: tetratricopeptide repeat protein [Candidatus Caccousia avicola]|uniref:Tetratricopeptide repeat protein n=1 Tax=Candidatus Caccousia avicola TaxID=2840721 RepID=A0A9D1AP81_9FIRM|nr:tetratricopeptide repeat protein [Candidatus Caccousia avicola]
MKRLLPLLLALLLCFPIVSCVSPAKAPDWEGQYELGMRFLSDGDWEQAIPALLSAIEIDPKRADAYLALADAYLAAGEADKARELLENVPSNIDNSNAIQEKLDELSGGTDDPSSTAENEATAPNGESAFQNQDGYSAFDDLPEEQQGLADHLLDTALSGGDLTEILESIDWNGGNFQTEHNGYKIRVSMTDMVQTGAYDAPALDGLEQHIRSLLVELRPKEGDGFLLHYQTTKGVINPVFDGDTGDIVGADLGLQTISESASCSCSNWQWNGSMTLSRTISTETSQQYLRGETVSRELWTQINLQTETGQMQNSLRTGTFTTLSESDSNLYGSDSNSWEETYAEGTDFVSLFDIQYASAAEAAEKEIW